MIVLIIMVIIITKCRLSLFHFDLHLSNTPRSDIISDIPSPFSSRLKYGTDKTKMSAIHRERVSVKSFLNRSTLNTFCKREPTGFCPAKLSIHFITKAKKRRRIFEKIKNRKKEKRANQSERDWLNALHKR